MLLPLGILASAGGAALPTDYELISTTLVTSAVSSITFSGLGAAAAAYKHLQIRWTARVSDNNSGGFARLNGDTGANYSIHSLYGNGSSVISDGYGSQTYAYIGGYAGNSDAANAFGVGVTDLLDFSSTSKNKTLRSLSGMEGSTNKQVFLRSGAWYNTAAVTSITYLAYSGNFAVGSRFSIYGLKG